MRIILAACFLLALAACSRQADENFRNGIRNGGIQACERDMRAELVRAGRWTDDLAPQIERVCACYVETGMENVSTSELIARGAREKTPAEREELARIKADCREDFDRRDMTAAEMNANPSRRQLREIAMTRGPDPNAPIPLAPPPVRARPQVALATLATGEDYPAAALRDRAQGRVGFALEIGTDGRVTRCEITASSGSAELDAATCRIIRSRALYEPAMNERRATVRDRDRGVLTWTLPAG